MINYKIQQPPNLLAPIVGLMLASLIIITTIFAYTLYKINEHAEYAKGQLISVVLNAELSRIENSVTAYANWDDAVQNFAVKYDPKWISDHFDNILLDEQQITYFLVYNGQNEIIHAFPKESVIKTIDQQIKYSIQVLRERSMNDDSITLSGNIIDDAGHIYFISMRRMTPVRPTIDKQYLQNILVFIERADGRTMERLKKQMAVSSFIGVSNLPYDHDNSVAIKGPAGTDRGYLYWQGDNTAADFVKAGILPLGIGAIIIMGLTIFIIRREQKTLQTITNSENLIRIMAVAINSARSPVVILERTSDGEYIIFYANQETERMFETDQCFKGATLSNFFTTETSKAHQDKLLSVLSNKSTGNIEILLSTKTNKPFWCEMIITPINNNDNTNMYVIIMNNITEKRRMRESAVQRDRVLSLGQLAGSVAHELNNLLQPAVTYSELLYDINKFSDPISQESLRGIADSCKGSMMIIRNVLNFSRQDEAEKIEMDLSLEIKSALRIVQPMMPRSLFVDMDVDTYVPMSAMLGRNQMSQLLTQLILNAAQATERRGNVMIKLERVENATSEAARLSMQLSDLALLSVTDNGCGMTPDVLRRAREPFFTTRDVGQGVGLGLTTAESIVQSWGGVMEIESEPGLGTNVKIFIPIKIATNRAA